MTTLPTTTIKFPELRLATREAHQLRGYFGRLFQEHSDLLHNHYDEGKLAYRYPLVQYKVIDQVPVLVGLGEGAELLVQLFLKMKEINISGKYYPVLSKQITAQKANVGLVPDLHLYQFKTRWMALNQQNYVRYQNQDPGQQKVLLKSILTANILAFYKACGLYLQPDERILVYLDTKETMTQFKNKTMLAFEGKFTTNALLPDYIGLGKSTSSGFGTITYCI